MSKTATIRCAELRFDKGILYIRFFENIEIDLNDVREMFSTGIMLSGGKPYCTMAYLTSDTASTPDSRAFSAVSDYAKFRRADALLTHSLPMKLIANSYIKFNKPLVPTKMFTDEKKAIDWLNTFLH